MVAFIGNAHAAQEAASTCSAVEERAGPWTVASNGCEFGERLHTPGRGA